MAATDKDTAALVAAARGGSREALGEVLEACRGYLLMVAQRELAPTLQAKGGASDLVQETFLEAQQDFAQFQGQSAEELLAWLRQVLLNRLANFRRHYRGTAKRNVAREIALDPRNRACGAPDIPARVSTPSKFAVANERAIALERALLRLPEEYRRVILLRHDEGHSFEEIGQQLGRTANAARKLWVRAIEQLEAQLDVPP